LSTIDQPDYPVQNQQVIRIDFPELPYTHGGFRLRIPALAVAPAEKVAPIGPAGSGKTTLLSLVAGHSAPDAGVVTVDQEPLNSLAKSTRRYLRITTPGPVFQDLALLDSE